MQPELSKSYKDPQNKQHSDSHATTHHHGLLHDTPVPSSRGRDALPATRPSRGTRAESSRGGADGEEDRGDVCACACAIESHGHGRVKGEGIEGQDGSRLPSSPTPASAVVPRATKGSPSTRLSPISALPNGTFTSTTTMSMPVTMSYQLNPSPPRNSHPRPFPPDPNRPLLRRPRLTPFPCSGNHTARLACRLRPFLSRTYLPRHIRCDYDPHRLQSRNIPLRQTRLLQADCLSDMEERIHP